MQAETLDLESRQALPSPNRKAAIAWMLILTALATAAYFGEWAMDAWQLDSQTRYSLQALIMSGIVLTGIWFLRTRVDKGQPTSIGVGSIKSAAIFGALGIGFFIVPLLLTIVLTQAFGWADVSLNTVDGFLSTFTIGILTVFLFEALPEELVFRGYIFSTLNLRFQKWKAGLITVIAFVALPIVLVQIQRYILGMDVSVGGTNRITGGYLIIMFFFASFTQYLRILTGSIWTGIGFHLVFVYINRLVGIEDTNLIQLSNISNETPMQIILISALLLVFLGVILYPILAKKKLGWKQKLETSEA